MRYNDTYIRIAKIKTKILTISIAGEDLKWVEVSYTVNCSKIKMPGKGRWTNFNTSIQWNTPAIKENKLLIHSTLINFREVMVNESSQSQSLHIV